MSNSCEIAYYPDYAFGETLAVFRDRVQSRNSLVSDMLWLASRLAEESAKSAFLRSTTPRGRRSSFGTACAIRASRR